MLNTYINEGKRTIVVVLTEGNLSFVGKAKCSPNDIFDESKGKKIALKRAQIKFYKHLKQMNSIRISMLNGAINQLQVEKEKFGSKIQKLEQQLKELN